MCERDNKDLQVIEEMRCIFPLRQGYRAMSILTGNW